MNRTCIFLSILMLSFKTANGQDAFRLLHSQDNVQFYYKWAKSCPTCDDYVIMKIVNNNGSKKDLHYNFQWISNGAPARKPDNYLTTISANAVRQGSIDGLWFHMPDGFTKNQLQVRLLDVYVCDYNVDCYKKNHNNGSAGNNQVNNERNNLIEAENRKLQQMEDEKQRQLEAQRARGLDAYNQSMSDLEKRNKQNEELIQQTAPLLEGLLDMEHPQLATKDDLFLIGASFAPPLNPVFISNSYTSLGTYKPGWALSLIALNKKGLSGLSTVHYISQSAPDFTFTGLSTAGKLADFSGHLLSKTLQVSLSAGKDFRSKNNKLHLFIGPSLGYILVMDHVFTYGSNYKEYRQEGVKDKVLFGFDGKLILFLGEGFGIKAGYALRMLFKKEDEIMNYRMGNYASADAGLFFRISI